MTAARKEDLSELSTTSETIRNMITTIIGTGILGVPYAIEQCSLYTGCFLLIICVLICNFSSHILIEVAKKIQIYSYENLAQHFYGNIGLSLVILSALIIEIGALFSYLIAIGDNFPVLFQDLFNLKMSRNVAIGLVSFFFILPVILLKSLKHVAITSTFSVLAMFLVIIMIISKGYSLHHFHYSHDYFPSLPADYSPYAFNKPYQTIISGIGIISFAFISHDGLFTIFNDLKDKTLKNWQFISNVSFLWGFIMTSLFGICGWLSFYGTVESDILLNFQLTDRIINLVRFIYAISISFTFPVTFFCCRSYILSILNLLKFDIGRGIKQPPRPEQGQWTRGQQAQEDQWTGQQAQRQEGQWTDQQAQLRQGLLEEEGQWGSQDQDQKWSPRQELSINDKEAEDNNNLLHLSSNMNEIKNIYFYSITSLLFLIIFISANLVTNLGLVLSITGAVGSAIVGYILPTAMYLSSSNNFYTLKSIICILILIFGLLVLILGIFVHN